MKLKLPSVLRDDRGTSLVEMAIVSAMFMVILVAVLQSLDSATRTETGQQARDQALQDVRGAMTRLTRDVRQATKIWPICPSVPPGGPCSSRTRLDMQTLMSGDGVDHHVAYELTGGALTRTLDGGSPIVLVDRLVTTGSAGPPFCYDSPDCNLTGPPVVPNSVRISLSLTPIISDQGAITLATDVELRNL